MDRPEPGRLGPASHPQPPDHPGIQRYYALQRCSPYFHIDEHAFGDAYWRRLCSYDFGLSAVDSVVFGDGKVSRDFCYVANVVQANLLAALAPSEALSEPIFNIACGARTSLLELFELLAGLVGEYLPRAGWR